MHTTFASLRADGVLEFGDGYRTKSSELAPEGFRILRAGDISLGQARFNSPEFVGSNLREAIGPKMVRAGDVILTTKGTVGRTAFVKEVPGPAVYSPQLCFFRANPTRLWARYLYYWFSSPEFKHQASSMQSSTDMAPYISLSQLSQVRISLPPLPEQQAIAEVLGALDDRIAANNKLCETEEALMVALVAGLARDCTLGDLARLSKTGVTAGQLASMEEVRHYSLPAFDDNRLPVLEPGKEILSGKFVVDRPAVLLSKLNPRFPRVWNIPTVELHAVASTEFLVLVPNVVTTGALWAVLAGEGTTRYLGEHAAGTSGSHQRVRPAEAMATPVPSAESLTSASLNERLSVMGQHVACVRRESQTLAELRDTLLPALMDGTIRVKDAISKAEEAL